MSQTSCHWRHLHVKEAQQDMLCLSDCVYPLLLLGGLFILSIVHFVEPSGFSPFSQRVVTYYQRQLFFLPCKLSKSMKRVAHPTCPSVFAAPPPPPQMGEWGVSPLMPWYLCVDAATHAYRKCANILVSSSHNVLTCVCANMLNVLQSLIIATPCICRIQIASTNFVLHWNMQSVQCTPSIYPLCAVCSVQCTNKGGWANTNNAN